MTARIFVLIGALLAAPVAGVAGQADTTKQEAAALARFDTRVAEYVTLHRRLEGPVPPQQLSDDMRVVRAAMDTLARVITDERKNAQRGDLFAPDVVTVFRARIAGCLPADELEEIVAEREPWDPVVIPPLQVNGRWPVGVPYNFVPPQLLASLPRLPSELQYRIVGRSLVLWDHHADLVVDYLPDAFPKPTAGGYACGLVGF